MTETDTQITRLEFGAQEYAIPGSDGAPRALAARAQAEAQARYVMALQRPRDPDMARVRMLKACERPRFAESALFRLPRGGKTIEGPTIRFAEEIARAWGHIQSRDEVVYEDSVSRTIRVEVLDLESGVSFSRDVTASKTVERTKTKDGDVILSQRLNSANKPVYLIRATDAELAISQNAQVSKALRVGILRVVPSDLVEEAIGRVRKTLSDSDAEDPNLTRTKLVDAFAAIGVLPTQLAEYLGHTVSDRLTPDEIKTLRGIYSGLKSEEITWSEVVEGRETKTIDVPPEKPKRTPRGEPKPAETRPATLDHADLLDKIIQANEIDGISKAETLAELIKIFGERPSPEQLAGFLARLQSPLAREPGADG